MRATMLFDVPDEFYPMVIQDFLVTVCSPEKKKKKFNFFFKHLKKKKNFLYFLK